MSKQKMPRPSTNPLEEEALTPDEIEATADVDSDIQRGMPARNLKTIFMLLLLAGVIIFLLVPRSKSVDIPTPTPKNTDGSVVNDLIDGLKKTPAPIAPVLIDDQIKAPVPPVGKAVVDERVQAALLAPMAASDVTYTDKKAAAAMRSSIEDKMQAAMASHRLATAQLGGIPAIPGQSNTPGRTSLAGLAGETDRGDAHGEAESHLSHEEFLSRQAAAGLAPSTKLMAARSANTLYEGTIVRVALTRSLKTDLPGIITAKVTTDLYDTLTQKVVLVPRGSEITCNYQSELMVGQKLVLAACSRLRMPNGKSFSLQAGVASSMQGASGLPAEIDNHFFEMFRNALVVGAASYLLPKSERSITSTETDAGREMAGSIAGTALSKIIDATIARNVIIPPTGTVEVGTPFTLTLTRDVELEPYFGR